MQRASEHAQREPHVDRFANDVRVARLSSLQEATASQFLALRRAQRALGEAEGKLGLLKKWDRQLENDVAPLVKQLDNLQAFLSFEMPKAAAYLAESVKILEAYASVAPPTSSSPSASAEPMPESVGTVALSTIKMGAAIPAFEEPRLLPDTRQREEERE